MRINRLVKLKKKKTQRKALLQEEGNSKTLKK